jgi:predicted metal-binding membrane protein
LILLGFLTVWVGYSTLISVFQAFLIGLSLVNKNGQLIYPLLSSIVLASAGLYQFSKFKNACASKCRAPLTFFMEFWSEGRMASLKMGLRLGLSCLGCCWMLMLLAFVGGTMSLLFMGLATVIMVLEKLPKLGDYISIPLGYVLVFSAGLNVVLTL